MFNAKQNRLLMILGMVSDKERMDMYECYCEVAGEMSANGMNPGSFTNWLERRVDFEVLVAKRKNEKSLRELA